MPVRNESGRENAKSKVENEANFKEKLTVRRTGHKTG